MCLRALIRNPEQGTAVLRYLFEDFTFDTERRELCRGASAVSIEPKVFDLLEYLIRNRERVVSKDDLINAVWNGRIVSDAAITTRLNAARSAILDSGEKQGLIRTLPRKGFRFLGSVKEVERSGPAAATAPTETSTSYPRSIASIAVLPFQNLSDDPEQDYFADGLVEDITTTLSRFKSLFVIARSSSFTYKGEAVDAKQAGRELGVRYVLEGSVRRATGRLRITGQLIDAANGACVWADRFEGPLADIFALQDEVTERVVSAVAPALEREGITSARRRPTFSVDAATEHYLGLASIYRPESRENSEEALLHFRRAIEIDPNFASPYGGAATCLSWRAINGWPSDHGKDSAEIVRFAQHIGDRGTDDAFALSLLAWALAYNRLDFDAACEFVDRAITENPNLALARAIGGWMHIWRGNPAAAVVEFERAIRLSPRAACVYMYRNGHVAFPHRPSCRIRLLGREVVAPVSPVRRLDPNCHRLLCGRRPHGQGA
jgi:TolB-like protein